MMNIVMNVGDLVIFKRDIDPFTQDLITHIVIDVLDDRMMQTYRISNGHTFFAIISSLNAYCRVGWKLEKEDERAYFLVL